MKSVKQDGSEKIKPCCQLSITFVAHTWKTVPAEAPLGAVGFNIFVRDLEDVMESILMDAVSLHHTDWGAGNELEAVFWRDQERNRRK